MKDKLLKLGLTDEMAQKVVDNFGEIVDGIYVTKERFNEINSELKKANETIKERDGQLVKLGESTKNVEGLKEEIEILKLNNKEAAKKAAEELMAERKSNAIKFELLGKVHNADITMSQLKMDNIIMDNNGKIVSGLKEQIEDLKKTDGYLFIPENNNNSSTQAYVKGATPKDGETVATTNISKAEQFAKSLAANNNNIVKGSKANPYFAE